MTKLIKPKGSISAKVLIVGDFPTLDCVAAGEPFSGYAGGYLDSWLGGVGLRRADCRVLYACSQRPPKGNILTWTSRRQKNADELYTLRNGIYISEEIQEGLDLLSEEIDKIKPNLIVALGNLAMWALTGNWGIAKWRGSLLQNSLTEWKCKVIPTVSISDVNLNPEWLPIVNIDFGRVKREHQTIDLPERNERFIVRPSLDQVIETLAMLEEKYNSSPESFLTSCDIETRGSDISCVGIAWSRFDAICIPFMDVSSNTGYWDEYEEIIVYNKLREFLIKVPQVGQNFKYDMEYFYWKFYFEPRWIRDTMISHHSMMPTGTIDISEISSSKNKSPSQAEKKGLGYLSSIYCKDHVYWKDELDDWDDEAEYWTYNCRDGVRTWEIDMVQQSLKKRKHEKQQSVTDFQNSMIPAIWHSMKHGVPVDLENKSKLIIEFKKSIKDRYEWLEFVLGYDLKINSPAQMKNLFYTDLGCKEIKKRSSAGGMVITCDDNAIKSIAIAESLIKPIIDVINDIKLAEKTLKEIEEVIINEEDNYIRFSSNIAGAKTFALSTTKTAFGFGMREMFHSRYAKQKFGLSMLPDSRKIFTSEKWKTLSYINLKYQDIFAVASESGCEQIINWMNSGLNPFLEIAKEYCKDENLTEDSNRYDVIRSLCYGANHLANARITAAKLSLLEHDVNKFSAWYFGKFPEIKKWQEEIKRQIQGRRYIENQFGFRSYFYGRISDATMQEGITWFSKSTEANILNYAIVNIFNDKSFCEFVLRSGNYFIVKYDIKYIDNIFSYIADKINKEIKLINNSFIIFEIS